VHYNPLLVPYTLYVIRLSPYEHWSLSCNMICLCSYTGISNRHNVSPSLFDISTQFDVPYNPLLVPCTLHVIRVSPYKHSTLSCHMSLFCSHTGISNHHNASPSLFDISRQFDVRYNPLLGPYTLHVTRLVHINTGPCHVI
jgi:hypothetical protein